MTGAKKEDDMLLPVQAALDSMGRPTREQIEQAIAALVAKGLVMDSGRRRFNPRTGRYDIVWVATEHYKPPEAFELQVRDTR
jgi:hypothetical protein